MIDETTNRLQGVNYDANGNQIGDQVYHNYVWNAENRMVQQLTAAGGGSWYGGTSYSYDPSGRRVMKNVNADPAGRNTGSGYGAGTWEFYFYGLNGRKLGTIGCGYDTGYLAGCWVTAQNAYFAGKLIVENGSTVATDRLGSLRANSNPDSSNVKYFPYGAEQTATSEGVTKFATYTRDAVGQDYAEQRYYNAGMGRFWSPDANGGSMAIPGSMNKYAYAGGDPVNLNDPRGLDPYCGPTGVWMGEGCYVTGITGTPGDCWALFGEMGCDSGTSGGSGTGPVTGVGTSGGSGDGDSGGGGGCGGGGSDFMPAPNPDPTCPVESAPPPAPIECDPGFLTNGVFNTSAADINLAARVIFAESSGNYNEDIAMADVILNRLNNKLFASGTLTTLSAVVQQPGQFKAITPPGPNQQFLDSAPGKYQNLSAADCANLAEAIQAMTYAVIDGAANSYNMFVAAGGHRGTQIGGSVFWTQSAPPPRRKKKRR